MRPKLKALFIMKNVYMVAFWMICVLFIIFVFYCAFRKDLSLIKDIGIPLGALIFTVGSLWHKKEDQMFEKDKYKQDRRDKYWDKRFDYYLELYDLIKVINYQLTDEDCNMHHPKYQKGELQKVFMKIKMLSDKSEILFDYDKLNKSSTVASYINEIKKEFKVIRDEKIKRILLDMSSTGTKNTPEKEKELMDKRLEAYEKEQEAKMNLETVYSKCKDRIFEYLRA